MSEAPLLQSAVTEVAAVDLGSNSFHLVIAQVRDGDLRVIDRLREPVRLGAGLDDTKTLSPECLARALECLQRFGQRLAHLPAECVRVVGTNTLRVATNGADLIEGAREVLGHEIEIVSGVEEARLIYQGVSHSIAADAARRLVIDIGGGSTELIIGEGYEPKLMESLYMGCVSSSRCHLVNGVLSAASLDKALLAAHVELEPKAAAYRRLGWDEVVGASGTIRAVDKVLKATGWAPEGITLAGLRRLREALIAAGDVSRLNLPGLSPDRAPVFPGGAMVLMACFEALGIDRMQASDGALREGVLYDLLGRVRLEDVRSVTVEALARRYHVDQPQAQRVVHTAVSCLQQVSKKWKLADARHGRRLTWAAQLHEIGLDIAHNHYHKHGAYVIEHADLAGFSMQEQRLVAALVLAHRRKFPVKAFRELAGSSKSLLRLAILLRLAAVLHRSRSAKGVPAFTLHPDKKSLAIAFSPGWLDEHPLTRADLEQEAAYLVEAGYTLSAS